MKKDSPDILRELKWRHTLTVAEEAQIQRHLAVHPEEQGEWHEETRLNEFLGQLPDAPLSSNFTSRVLRAVEVENLKDSRKRGWPAWRVGFGWVSRLAMAGFIFLAGLMGFHQYQATQRMELAQSVAHFSGAALPAEWLQDFDTIKNLNMATAVDDELLAALK